MPQMCQEHWDRIRENTDTPLLGQVYLVQRIVDEHGEHNDVDCPVCHYDDGEDILEESIEEIK